MAWSRLRSRWRELRAPCIARRVDTHMAGYRKRYLQRGRAWMTIDGVEVANFCELTFESMWWEEGRQERPTGWPYTDAAREKVRAAGVRDKMDLLDAMGTCIGSPIGDLLKHDDPLVRALAMLDRRLGKRRLARLDVTGEAPLVLRLYSLRCEAEAAAAQSKSEIRKTRMPP